MDAESVFGAAKPVVGMVHLPALPGAPRYGGSRERVRTAARRDARRLAEGGVDAVLVENFGDAPYYPDEVPAHVVAEMTALVGEVRAAADCPVGVNVLRNDAAAAVAVAAAAGGVFVRVNVHVGARVTDQGVVEGRAHETMRLRERLDADVAVLADVAVKHSAPLGGGEGASLAEVTDRGLADGVVVTGRATGRPTPVEDVERAVARRDEASPGTPVFVGSGVTADAVADVLRVADGVVVGTALKEGGETRAPVEVARVEDLVAAADAVR